jgi:hypothetical protein
MTRVVNTNTTRYATLVNTGVYNNGAGLIPINSSSSNVAETLITQRSGGNTAGYHNPKRVGPLNPTSFSFYYSRLLGEQGYDYHYDVGLKPNQYGYSNTKQIGCYGGSGVPGHTLPSQSDVDRLLAQASNGVLSKIKSQSVNLGQAYAERAQTARLIGDAAIRIAKTLNNLKKGNFVGAARDLGVGVPKRAHARFKKSYPKRQAEAVSQAWLELQYGWKPLLSDVYGAAEQLAQSHNRPATKTVKSRKSKTIPISYRTKVTYGKAVLETVRTGTSKVDVTYSITYAMTSPNIASAKEMGLTNPLLIAWELLPFSFVADWFVPIGSYIGNLDATLGCTFLNGYRTIYQIADSTSMVSYNGIDNYSVQQNGFKVGQMKDVRVDRATLSGFPSPTFPPVKNPASYLHCANAIALLTQLFRK